MTKKKVMNRFDQTIEETMFLAHELIGDEEKEDRMIVHFYEEAAGDDLSKEELCALLIREIHQVLASDEAYGNHEKEVQDATYSAKRPLRSDRTGRLISGYYRDRRASFSPDRARIARLEKEIEDYFLSFRL